MKRAACLILALALPLLSGCGTVAPPVVYAKQASWDKGGQNSGLVAVVDSRAQVAPHWRDRYNAYVVKYGAVFTPALTKDEGLAPGAPNGNWYANHFARVHMEVMSRLEASAMHQSAAVLQKYTTAPK